MTTEVEAVQTDGSTLPPATGGEIEIEGNERLVGLLAHLISEHGRKETATVIGIGYKTLQRSLTDGRMSERLRLALERHMYLRAGADVPDSPVVARLDAVEERIGKVEELARSQAEVVARLETLEQRLSQLEERTSVQLESAVERINADLGRLRSELNRKVAGLEDAVGSLAIRASDLAEKVARSAGPQVRQRRVPVTVVDDEPEPDHLVEAEPESVPTDVETRALLEEWEAVVATEQKGRTGLERARAAERKIAVELELIRKHRVSIPPGELWAPGKCDREVEWRWYALDDRMRRRQRYECRRFARRVITLGLWRS